MVAILIAVLPSFLPLLVLLHWHWVWKWDVVDLLLILVVAPVHTTAVVVAVEVAADAALVLGPQGYQRAEEAANSRGVGNLGRVADRVDVRDVWGTLAALARCVNPNRYPIDLFSSLCTL